MLQGFDRAHVLAHHLARLFEIEAEHHPVQHHVSLILRELSQGIRNLVQTKPLVDGVQRIVEIGRLDLAGLDLRMAVLGSEPIHDLGVCDLEEPTDEFAFGPAAKTSDGLQRCEVDLLEEVLSGSLLANVPQEVAKDSSVRCFVELREGVPIGAKVTLRGARMYEFLDRLINVALPRVRDFRGLNPKSFDGRGNYTIGIKEHIVFPEIDYDKTAEVWGMDITVCTTARTDEEARALLTAFNFPFRQ